MGKLNKKYPVYSRLLRLYPPSYHERYGQQMLQTLDDMLAETESKRERAGIWFRTAWDFPISLIRQQGAYVSATAHDMPAYTRRSTIIGAILLTPFFLFIILNALLNERMSHSVFWHTQMLFVWLVALPVLAILINISALARWSYNQHRAHQKTGFWQSYRDLKWTWSLIAIIAIGFSILGLVFFHDSVHCVTGNPLHELTNWHETWQCIQAG